MCGSRGGQGSALQVTASRDPLKKHIATKPAFNDGPSSARKQNSIKWRFASEPMMDRLL